MGEKSCFICNNCAYLHGRSPCIPELIADASAYIQQLEDHINDLTKMVPRWIPTAERQPKYYGPYYCYADPWGTLVGRYDGGEWFLPSKFVDVPCDPTHWLEVPDPPKEG